MMAVQTTAGTIIAVDNALPATYDQAGFEALSYDTVGEIIEIGEFGKEYALVTLNTLEDRKTQKFKGSYNNGSIGLQLAIDTADTGQTTMKALRDLDTSGSFKVTYQDSTVDYFTGKVMSYKKNVGASDSILSASVTVEIDSDVVNV
jgi:hypothetical protein